MAEGRRLRCKTRPPPRRYLGEDPELPTCIKVAFPHGTDEAGAPKVLEKSYSPVSHPATEGEVELLVKGYPPRPGGFTGPDPYDPYGPDSPEPRPFQNPGAEMCHSLLETYTGNCAFPARSGNV